MIDVPIARLTCHKQRIARDLDFVSAMKTVSNQKMLVIAAVEEIMRQSVAGLSNMSAEELKREAKIAFSVYQIRTKNIIWR